MPGELLDQQSADHWSGGRPQDRDEHQDARDVDPLVRREGAIEHGHADRRQDAAADALQGTEEDQLIERAGQSAGGRGKREDGERDQEHALRAEAIA